jgi:hypothetical protein
MLFNNLFKNDSGNLEVILMNNEGVTAFAEKVKHLCDNDPTKYHGVRVVFEFSLKSEIGNLVEFDRLFEEAFLIRKDNNEL